MAGKPIPVAVGTRSGQIEVLEEFHNGKLWQLKVRCDCGNEKIINKSNFTSGKTTTCGCGPRGKPFPKEHGYSQTYAYNSWKKMMQRCYDPSDKDYAHYGARGIKVCEHWHSVENFVSDMGERLQGFSLERVDVNEGHKPGNCIWLPHALQAANRTDWQHTEEGRKAISDSRKKDWKEGVYASKVAAQRNS